MTPARRAPLAEPEPQVLVTARVAGQERSHRLFLIEKFSLVGGKVRAEDSLSLPEPDDLRPATPRTARIDKFFLDLSGVAGYWFSDIPVLPELDEWQRCWKYLERSDLVELRQLLGIFFPTLAARSLDDLTAAFRLSPQDESESRLQQIVEICESKARSLSRGQLRQLRKHSASLETPLSAWIEKLKPSATATEFDIDTAWFTDLDRHSALTEGETVEPEQVSKLLADQSLGESLIDGFELRQGQSRYAAAVSKALDTEQFLLAEAATGTGKSIGYLLPTIVASQATKSRAVVVTRTKSLQGQLFTADLRKLKKLLPPGFKTALLKGIANYLCLLRYNSLIGEIDIDQTPEQALLALQIWKEETASGDLAEVELLARNEADKLSAQVTIDEQGCLGQNCPYYKECYAFRARRRAQKSDLVITNYALLLADLVTDARILGRFAYAILDEAHRFEDEATRAFSIQLSPARLARLLEHHAARQTRETLELLLGSSRDELDEFQEAASRLLISINELSASLAAILQEPNQVPGARRRFMPGDRVHSLIGDTWQREEANCRELNELLAEILVELSGIGDSSQKTEIAEARRRLTQLSEALEVFKALAREDGSRLVMWSGLTSAGNVYLTGAPLQIGELLSQRFYPGFKSIVFTSATLDSEDDFAWVSQRLGLAANPDIGLLKLKQRSPFALSEQLKVMVTGFLPPPNASNYASRLAELLLKLRHSVKMSTLVLCTSHQMIKDLAAALKSHGSFPGELLLQRPDVSAPRLLARFRASRGAMLIGTESFWEGVDLPDDTLRLLVLTRLPFPVPDDPLEQVKSEQAEALGQSPFMTVSLPTAILKFRQALGRVIRSASDWGAVLVSDSRMSRKRYGAIFHEAAGVPVDTAEHPSLLLRDLTDWLYHFRGEEQ